MRPLPDRVIMCLKAVYAKLATEGREEIAVRELLPDIGELNSAAVHRAIQELEKLSRHILSGRHDRVNGILVKYVRFATGGEELARQILPKADALPLESPSA